MYYVQFLTLTPDIDLAPRSGHRRKCATDPAPNGGVRSGSVQRCGWVFGVLQWFRCGSLQRPQVELLSRWWFQIFVYFHLYLGKIPILTNIFQMGWNHQPAIIIIVILTITSEVHKKCTRDHCGYAYCDTWHKNCLKKVSGRAIWGPTYIIFTGVLLWNTAILGAVCGMILFCSDWIWTDEYNLCIL